MFEAAVSSVPPERDTDGDGTFIVENAVAGVMGAVGVVSAGEAAGGVNAEVVASVVKTEVSDASAFVVDAVGDVSVPCMLPEVNEAGADSVLFTAPIVVIKDEASALRRTSVLAVEGAVGSAVPFVSIVAEPEVVPVVRVVGIP